METKTCCKCKKNKPLNEFNKRRASKDGYQPRCKSCHATHNKKHYKENKQAYVDRANRQRIKRKMWFKELKSTFACEECGENKPWRLDFHHPDSEDKEANISCMVTSGRPKKEILKEIDKCQILCKHCHADIHHKWEWLWESG